MEKPQKQRVYILDALRFIAAFGVMLYHLTYRMPTIDHVGGPEFPEINGATRYLHLGVELFFMISGFVIAYSAEGKTALQFAWSRFVRLYPAYWFCVALTFALCHFFWRPYFELSLGQGLVNLTMLQAFFRVPHVDWPYWTLAEELRFYGLMFILIALKQSHRLLAFVAVWMAVCAIDLVKHVPLAHYEMTLDHAPFFAAGVVYYDAFKRGFRAVHGWLASVTLALGCKRFLDWSIADGAATHAFCSPVIVVAMLVGMHVIFVLISLNKLAIRKNYRWLSIAGGITYPLYLIHNRLGVTAMLSLEPAMNRWAALALTCTAACFVAYAIWRWWEIPVSAWMHRVGRRWTARRDA